jgi:hypothetical protein
MIQMTPTMAEDAVVVKERLCFAELVYLRHYVYLPVRLIAVQDSRDRVEAHVI